YLNPSTSNPQPLPHWALGPTSLLPENATTTHHHLKCQSLSSELSEMPQSLGPFSPTTSNWISSYLSQSARRPRTTDYNATFRDVKLILILLLGFGLMYLLLPSASAQRLHNGKCALL